MIGKEERERTKQEIKELKQVVEVSTWAGFNTIQLWYLWLGLCGLALVPELKDGVSELADQIKAYGIEHHGWSASL